MGTEGVLAMEDALLKRLASADPDTAEEALGQLYERHAQAVHVFAARALQDLSLAARVVEEVFLDLYRRCEDVDLRRESVRAYLVKQAHRRCTEMQVGVRGRDRTWSRPFTSVGERGVDVVDATTPASALSQDERVVLDLAWLGEMSCAEVAAFLHLPERTIRLRMREGLRRVAIVRK